MARPRKTDAPNLGAPCNLTVGAIERLTCPPGKDQAFLRDAEGNGLRVRVSPTGAKTFVFEQRLRGKTIRRAIGAVSAWSIEKARAEAKRLSAMLDAGIDPRDLDREEAEAKAAAATARATLEATEAAKHAADAVTVGQAWERYIAERRPHWSERTYADHLRLAQAGGRHRLRGKGQTKPGPLAPLMRMRLIDVDGAAVEAWAKREAPARAARVRLALRLLKAFLRWAAAEPDLKDRVDSTAASTKKAREAAGKPSRNDVVLQREQLRLWFDSVARISNPTIAAYLQCLLLTGRRREQVMALRWGDVDFQWKTITMRDKTEGEVMVPLTPYMAHLMSSLPRRNEWIFSSIKAVSADPKNRKRRQRKRSGQKSPAPDGNTITLSLSGRLVEPSIAHRRACARADIHGLTLHGLRRSFATLSEWVETPAGIAAQIQGHAPQGVREQHYIRRPIDILRMWHEKIEAWMLDQAGVKFDAATAPAALHALAA